MPAPVAEDSDAVAAAPPRGVLNGRASVGARVCEVVRRSTPTESDWQPTTQRIAVVVGKVAATTRASGAAVDCAVGAEMAMLTARLPSQNVTAQSNTD